MILRRYAKKIDLFHEHRYRKNGFVFLVYVHEYNFFCVFTQKKGSHLTKHVQWVNSLVCEAEAYVCYKVRECTWNGRPDGPVKGDTARVLLEHCLLLQVHLQEDWRARTSYVRTIALALMTWQPWMSRLPGCVFVEESCEAMNSRLAAACRSNPVVTSFDGVLALYLLLDPPSAAPHHSRGQLRAGLVQDMAARLRALVSRSSGRLFPEAIDATRFRWVDGSQSNWMARGPLPRRHVAEAYTAIFQTVLGTVTAGRAMPTEVRDWLEDHVADRPAEEVAVIQGTLDRIRAWRTGGRTGGRAAAPASSSTALTPAAAPMPMTTQDSHPAEDDREEESLSDTESLYEPPGSEPSAGYVSPGWTEDSDLYTEASSPSPAVSSGDEELD